MCGATEESQMTATAPHTNCEPARFFERLDVPAVALIPGYAE